MRVRVAYISSLGTTAILIAAALTLLTIAGTIVAFRGWPGSTDSSGVQSVPLAPAVTPSHPAALIRRSTATISGTVRKASVAHQVTHVSTAGLVKTAARGPRVVPGFVMVPVHTAPPMSAQPISPGPAPVGQQPPSNPAPTRDLPPDSGGQSGPVPATGSGPTLPALDPIAPPAAPDQITGMVGELLTQGPPPPLDVIGTLGLRR